MTERTPPFARWSVLLAFAAIYLIWSSTYLAIRFAIETLPPYVMTGTRFLTAGALMYAWTRLRGAPPPTPIQWRSAALIGALMLLGGMGSVAWAEQRITSGMAALLVTTMPFWIVLLDWARGGGRPGGRVVFGLLLGFGGVAVLLGPGELFGGPATDLTGAGAVLGAAVCWAAGSLYSRGAELPRSPFLGVGMEMLAGGVLLLAVATLRGEWDGLAPDAVSLASLLAWGYLTVFGSLIAFTAYIWLLKVVPAARVATYAYVNPLLAVLLGWALAGEPLTSQTLIAAPAIVGAVVLINTARQRAPAPAPDALEAAEGA